ncbi:hypothetical protein ACLKA6_002113 [Drosophila palustris]
MEYEKMMYMTNAEQQQQQQHRRGGIKRWQQLSKDAFILQEVILNDCQLWHGNNNNTKYQQQQQQQQHQQCQAGISLGKCIPMQHQRQQHIERQLDSQTDRQQASDTFVGPT